MLWAGEPISQQHHQQHHLHQQQQLRHHHHPQHRHNVTSARLQRESQSFDDLNCGGAARDLMYAGVRQGRQQRKSNPNLLDILPPPPVYAPPSLPPSKCHTPVYSRGQEALCHHQDQVRKRVIKYIFFLQCLLYLVFTIHDLF